MAKRSTFVENPFRESHAFHLECVINGVREASGEDISRSSITIADVKLHYVCFALPCGFPPIEFTRYAPGLFRKQK